ncbi:helix-turn-helix transcriptional regulator [Planctomycetota bacterium]
MLTNTKTIIEAAMNGDATLTQEQRATIAAALNPGKKEKPKLITTKQAAKVLDVSTVTLRKYEKQGLLHPIRYTRRRIRWDLNEVEAFRDRGLQEVPA